MVNKVWAWLQKVPVIFWWLALTWLTPPALVGIGWVVYTYTWLANYDYSQMVRLSYYNHVPNGTLFWWYFIISCGISLWIVVYKIIKSDQDDVIEETVSNNDWYPQSYRTSGTHVEQPDPEPIVTETKEKPKVGDVINIVLAALLSVGLIVSTIGLIGDWWGADKDEASYYNASTVFHSPSFTDVPASLSNLIAGATPVNGDPHTLHGAADVPSTIVEDPLPQGGWEGRNGSWEGAKNSLTQQANDIPGVKLIEDTVTYLNRGGAQEKAGWSGVLDGNGSSVHMAGVAILADDGNIKKCTFTGQYAIDRAFNGSLGNSMDNLVRSQYPYLNWDLKDVWGYCNGDEPVVVIPVTTPIPQVGRTVDTAAGIIVVQGDNGVTKLTYKSDVAPGEYPGPVYSISLTATQREMTQWAAGREYMNRRDFGYEPSDLAVQAGNVSEYLLRDVNTGRLVYVTPLTPRRSNSEWVVAYAVSYADEVHAGSLNTMNIYALADNDPRRVNIEKLDNLADEFVGKVRPGFKVNNEGKLLEFTPMDGVTWRAFGEYKGIVRYRLNITSDNAIDPQLVDITTPTDVPSGGEPNALCGKPFTDLNNTDFARCIQVFGDESVKRLGQN